MNKLIKIIIICLSITFAFNNTALFSADIDELVSNGKLQYKHENYKSAYDNFKKAMKINPNHFEASKWYWKMKKEFDVKNLKDKGPISQVEEQKEAETRIEKETRIDATTDKSPGPVAQSIPAGETDKTVLRKMNRINRQLSMLSKDLKQFKKLSTKPEQKTFIDIVKESPMIIALIALLAFTSIVLITGLLWHRMRMSKIPQAPQPGDTLEGVHYQDGFSDEHIHRLPTESVDNRMLILETAKKLIGHPDANVENLSKVFSALSTNGDDRIRSEAQEYLVRTTGHEEAHHRPRGQLPAPSINVYDMETIAEGYIYLLEKKIQRGYNDRKVRDLAGEIGIHMGLYHDDIRELRLAALLKDIGFIMVPEKIMNKSTKLTAKNRELAMKEIAAHIEYSADIARAMALPEQVVGAIYYHHERYNGTGYPDGLSGNNIPYFARIIGIADSFVALISDRPFRKGYTIDEAVDILGEESYLFDPDIFQAFKELTELIKMSGPSANGLKKTKKA